MASQASGDSANSGASAGNGWLGGAFLLLLLLGLILLVIGLTPTDLPPDKSANFIDSIFHNKGVVLAARLLLVSAAVVLALGGIFIVGSMVIRMKNGEWLKRAGPFEIKEAELGDLEAQTERWRNAAKAAQEEVAELGGRLGDSDELIEKLKDEIEEMRLEIDDGRRPNIQTGGDIIGEMKRSIG